MRLEYKDGRPDEEVESDISKGDEIILSAVVEDAHDLGHIVLRIGDTTVSVTERDLYAAAQYPMMDGEEAEDESDSGAPGDANAP